jgi:hypothetical protein
MLGRHPITDGLCGGAFGLALASADRKTKKTSSFGTHVAIGSALGVALGALVRLGQGAPKTASSFVGFNPMFVGWSQPPRPADVIASFDPKASKRDQARAVLYDYFHDDALRSWADDGDTKKCFGAASKEQYNPIELIAAYENPDDKVWKCDHNVVWSKLDIAVQNAIKTRTKLGPLPKSTYVLDPTTPTVIYYYDGAKMKRITYPAASVPDALNPNVNRYWDWGKGSGNQASSLTERGGLDDIHVRETDDPKKIAVERAYPGWITLADKQKLKVQYPWLSDMGSGSAGDWGNEGWNYDKNIAGTGIIGTLTGAILAVVSAILDATGVGAAVGVPLAIATPFIVMAINTMDMALHTGDWGAALAHLGPALIQASVNAAGGAAGGAGFQIPPAAVKAVGNTVSNIAKDVIAGQQKKQDFGEIWAEVAKKAKSYGKLGDDEADAIAKMLGGPGGKSQVAGNLFIHGYLAGKMLDQQGLTGIANILQSYAKFADPRIINIALLGMGIGHIAATQKGTGYVAQKAALAPSRAMHTALPTRATRATTRATHATHGYNHYQQQEEQLPVLNEYRVGWNLFNDILGWTDPLTGSTIYNEGYSDQGEKKREAAARAAHIADVHAGTASMQATSAQAAAKHPAAIGTSAAQHAQAATSHAQAAASHARAAAAHPVAEGKVAHALEATAHTEQAVAHTQAAHAAIGNYDPVTSSYDTTTSTGFNPVPTANTHAHTRTGAFFYDPSLAQYGNNAISPIVQMPYERAQQAMRLRPEDRYGPRLDGYDWRRWW